MSQSTPTIVTVAQQFSGQHRTFSQSGGHVTQGELQSLAMRLRGMIKVAASLADTVEQIRERSLQESSENTKV